MRRIVVPPSAGLFSSFGLLYADVEYHFSRTFRRHLRTSDLAEIEAAWRTLVDDARAQLATEGFTGERASITRSAAMHYAGQSFELVVPVPDGPMDVRLVRALEEAFGQEHERVYGHRAGPDEPVELVSMQVLGRGMRDGDGVPERVTPSRAEPEPGPPRPAYFGAEHGWIETRVLRRSDLVAPVSGPAIVEEYDATCVLPPGTHAELDAAGNIVIEL